MEIVILVVVLMLVAAVAVAAGVLDRPRRVARRTRVVERPVRERVVEVERPAREVVEPMGEAARADVFGGAARRFYHLQQGAMGWVRG